MSLSRHSIKSCDDVAANLYSFNGVIST